MKKAPRNLVVPFCLWFTTIDCPWSMWTLMVYKEARAHHAYVRPGVWSTLATAFGFKLGFPHSPTQLLLLYTTRKHEPSRCSHLSLSLPLSLLRLSLSLSITQLVFLRKHRPQCWLRGKRGKSARTLLSWLKNSIFLANWSVGRVRTYTLILLMMKARCVSV